jgi:chromosome partitioning protein
MPLSIAFFIFKGGTGKTTSAVNVAAGLAYRGKRVLLVDLDQQANSTKYVGLEPDDINPTFYHVFTQHVPISVIRKPTAFGFDVIPSSSLMTAIEESLEPGDELLLRSFLEPLKADYDFILLDTPPGKAMLAFNGILAADLLLVPASADRMAIDGVSDLVRHVQSIFWHKFTEELEGQEFRILITRYRASTKHSPSIVHAAQRVYRENVLDMVIPEAIDFPRSFERRSPIINLDPRHVGSLAYLEVADWLIAYAETQT